MSSKISASLMCADLLNLEKDLKTLENLGVEYLHLDFMDGQFVSNITFGTSFIRACRKAVTDMKLDIHIMGYKPEQYFDLMEISNGDIVAFHYEACDNHLEVIEKLHNMGAKAFLTLSPDTPVEVINDYINIIDGVLIMTVYPGDSGKPLVPGSFEKLAKARSIIDASGRDIVLEVDGCVSWVNAPKMREAGAEMFVVGTSSVFAKDSTYDETVPRFRKIIQ